MALDDFGSRLLLLNMKANPAQVQIRIARNIRRALLSVPHSSPGL
jgi:hypothetical protein